MIFENACFCSGMARNMDVARAICADAKVLGPARIKHAVSWLYAPCNLAKRPITTQLAWHWSYLSKTRLTISQKW